MEAEGVIGDRGHKAKPLIILPYFTTHPCPIKRKPNWQRGPNQGPKKGPKADFHETTQKTPCPNPRSGHTNSTVRPTSVPFLPWIYLSVCAGRFARALYLVLTCSVCGVTLVVTLVFATVCSGLTLGQTLVLTIAMKLFLHGSYVVLMWFLHGYDVVLMWF